MHLLQSSIDISVIALWLGHESIAITHMYVDADQAIKEAELQKSRNLMPNFSAIKHQMH